jgi:Na+(H+)/acetate symporter ActP
MVYSKKRQEQLSAEQERLEADRLISTYQKKAKKYYKAGDLVSVAGIYQLLSEIDPRYKKLRKDILAEMKDKGDMQGYAIAMGAGDKKELSTFVNQALREGRKEEAAYALISAGEYRRARKVIAGLHLSGEDEKAVNLGMSLIEGKKAKQRQVAAMHYEEQQAAKAEAEPEAKAA